MNTLAIKQHYWNFCNTLSDVKSFYRGVQAMERGEANDDVSYQAMRRLFVKTNGRSNDVMSRLVAKRHRRKTIQSDEGIFDHREIKLATKRLQKDGYYVFSKKLPNRELNALQEFGKSHPCRAILNTDPSTLSFKLSETKQPYSRDTISPKFNFDCSDLLNHDTVQSLIMDPSIREIAGRFLGCEPILDLLAMWWSQPCGGEASTSAAQLYHFDLDRIKFLKFFFYLTDVTPETGPHCYIKGSSKRKPNSILRDGRIMDAEINRCYNPDQIVEICGEAGTIIAVDTRGFHKGKVLSEDNRLLFQLEMSNSLFGQSYELTPINENWDSSFRNFATENRRYLGVIDHTENV